MSYQERVKAQHTEPEGLERFPFLLQLAENQSVSIPELHLMESLVLANTPAGFVEQQVLRMIFRNADNWALNGIGQESVGEFRRRFGC